MSRPKQEGKKELHYLSASVIFIVFLMSAVAILHLDAKTTNTSSIDLVKATIWPTFFLGIILLLQQHLLAILTVLIDKISSVTEIAAPYLTFKTETAKIPSPAPREQVTLDNVALLHTSFLRPEVSKQFADGMTYYQIEVVVAATNITLDRIESVTYELDPSYPKQPPTILDRKSRFKLKELANGTSIIKASIKFRDQEHLLLLNRYIDLRPDGPRI